ncbi:class B sortase [Butyrivibrio sp. AE3004]|uniref:class B sortase n=1 Tax=Butyrivibrio sp. AE3004 TaxID=1506994 RepID=UPI000689FF0C|nr:class B sortase [Butyrivibrio sp. AE3004]
MNNLKKKIILRLVLAAKSANEKNKKYAKQRTYFVLGIIVFLNVLFYIPEKVCLIIKYIFEMFRNKKIILAICGILLLGFIVLGTYTFIKNKDILVRNETKNDSSVEESLNDVAENNKEIIEKKEEAEKVDSLMADNGDNFDIESSDLKNDTELESLQDTKTDDQNIIETGNKDTQTIVNVDKNTSQEGTKEDAEKDASTKVPKNDALTLGTAEDTSEKGVAASVSANADGEDTLVQKYGESASIEADEKDTINEKDVLDASAKSDIEDTAENVSIQDSEESSLGENAEVDDSIKETEITNWNEKHQEIEESNKETTTEYKNDSTVTSKQGAGKEDSTQQNADKQVYKNSIGKQDNNDAGKQDNDNKDIGKQDIDNKDAGKQDKNSINVSKQEINSEVDFSKEDLALLKKEYPETVGWIYIEGTDISYPIMQSSDNAKYLKIGQTGEPADTGAIFLDCRSADDFSDANSIVYGHNMKDHSMFGKLRAYREDPKYYNDHQYFQIITEDKIYRYQIFAYMDVPNDYEIFDYVGDASEAFISDAEPVRRKSYMDSEIPVTKIDKVVTLSTCTSQDDLRFVVLGVLEETTELSNKKRSEKGN